MNGILCLLNKKCRVETSKTLVQNLQQEQDSVEQIYNSTVSNTESK